VGVGDDQLDAGEPRALSERRNAVQKEPSSLSPTSRPSTSRPLSAVTPVAITTALGDHPAVDAGLEVGGVQNQVREGGVGQGAGAERGHLGVQLATDPGDLGLGDAAVDTRSSTLRVEVPCT
jgi:hypothetical protein